MLLPVAGVTVSLVACADVDTGARPAAIDWSRAEQFTVIMTEYRFSPDQLVFRHGVAYRLRLENHGSELHEFTAPAFLAAIELRDPSVLAPAKHEIAVAPHRDRTLAFVARRPGRYDLICADHDWAGMVGAITIE
jgi:uncharacterized cupredoxin-like copper-binding protein